MWSSGALEATTFSNYDKIVQFFSFGIYIHLHLRAVAPHHRVRHITNLSVFSKHVKRKRRCRNPCQYIEEDTINLDPMRKKNRLACDVASLDLASLNISCMIVTTVSSKYDSLPIEQILIGLSSHVNI